MNPTLDESFHRSDSSFHTGACGRNVGDSEIRSCSLEHHPEMQMWTGYQPRISKSWHSVPTSPNAIWRKMSTFPEHLLLLLALKVLFFD